MSYLFDALRKAELERYAREHHDLRSVSAGETRHADWVGQRLLISAVIALVVLNVGLMLYLIWPGQQVPVLRHGAPSAPRGSAAGQSASFSRMQAAAAHASAASAATPPDARKAPKNVVDSGLQGSRGPKAAQALPTHGVSIGVSSASSVPGTDDHGSVIISTRPLAATSGASPASPFSQASPADASAGRAPKVTINGQLYSSVPGRSFILVNGQRYHEGERLASGPAVESIGRNGAELLYHGERFHVRGPG